MKKILFINSCVRGNSRTKRLADYVFKKFDGRDNSIKEVNLAKENIKPLDNETLEQRTALSELKDFSHPLFSYAKDFAASDIILIAAPYWDLSFPALLKCYIEAINIVGLTFAYSPEGIPYGLCKAEKIIYVTTAGGTITEDFGFSYIKTLAQNFYNIKDVVLIKAQNLDIVGADVEKILKQTEENIDKMGVV